MADDVQPTCLPQRRPRHPTDFYALFTDGCSGLRSILVKAGITKPPGLDWFHIAMRLQHAEKTAGTLPVDTPEREHARAVIVAEVDRLR